MALVLIADAATTTSACSRPCCSASPPRRTGSTAASRAAGTSRRKLGSFLDTTADKLLVSGVLIALLGGRPRLAVDRRDHHRPRARAHGPARRDRRPRATVMAPSMLGKLKTSVQFLAIALAILRPGRPDRRPLPRRVGDARRRRDHRLVGGRLPRARAAGAHRATDAMTPRLPHRRRAASIGGALAAPAGRARRRGGRARPLRRRGGARSRAARRARRARRRARRGRAGGRHARAASSSTTSPASTRCARPTRRRCSTSTSAAPRPRCAPPRAPACARVVLTSSAAALGEAHGTVGSEDSPHRGSYLSVYERSKHEGELAAFAAARRAGHRARRRSTRPPSRARAARAAPAGS